MYQDFINCTCYKAKNCTTATFVLISFLSYACERNPCLIRAPKSRSLRARTRRIRFHVPLLHEGCVTVLRNSIFTLRDYVHLVGSNSDCYLLNFVLGTENCLGHETCHQTENFSCMNLVKASFLPQNLFMYFSVPIRKNALKIQTGCENQDEFQSAFQ